MWDSMRRLQRVQVFGAGRAVGREVAAELLRAGHPAGLISLFGRRATAFAWQGGRLDVRVLAGDPPPAELAFVCTTREVGRALVPRLARRGTRVVDLSGACRDDATQPLIVDAINGAEVSAFSEYVALPERSAYTLIRTLRVLDEVAHIQEVDAFCVLSAASEGARGILALREELASAGAPASGGERRVGNLGPARGEPDESEPIESSIARDVRRVLGRPDLGIDLMAMSGDSERCDSFAVKVRFAHALEATTAARLLDDSPGIRVEASAAGPRPADCAGSDLVHVGRIRAGSAGLGSLCFFAVADQLRAGAASAALRVACRLPAVG